MATKTLYVGNLPYDVTESDLRNHFSKYNSTTVRIIEGRALVSLISMPRILSRRLLTRTRKISRVAISTSMKRNPRALQTIAATITAAPAAVAVAGKNLKRARCIHRALLIDRQVPRSSRALARSSSCRSPLL